MNTIGVSFLDPLDDYEIIHQIGSGTYGDVFKVRMKLFFFFLGDHLEIARSVLRFNLTSTF